MNGDLRVAYRASREGPRDIVFVPNWFTCCEVLPEIPSIQGWVEAMTSLGRLIYFDQPGTGASDPISPGALPTLEQWADSITAVLDDLGSPRSGPRRGRRRLRARGAVRGDTSVPHHRAGRARRVTRMRVAPHSFETKFKRGGSACRAAGETQHVRSPDMPWNEEIRAAWARHERLAASPGTVALMLPLIAELDVRAVLPTIRVPTLVLHHTDDVTDPTREGQVHRRAHSRREIC